MGDAAYWDRLTAPAGIWRRLLGLLTLLIVCGACYGFTIGYWRSSLQGVYAGIKFPLLLILTATGNAAANGMLGQALGSRLGFRETFAAVLSSFAILAIAVGSLAPITMFFLLNMPGENSAYATQSHCALILLHMLVIAGAGIAATTRLYGFIASRAASGRAPSVLFAWLAANLFFGAQLSWNLRPYVGTPSLPVSFLREEPFDGTFYEAVFRAAADLFF